MIPDTHGIQTEARLIICVINAASYTSVMYKYNILNSTQISLTCTFLFKAFNKIPQQRSMSLQKVTSPLLSTFMRIDLYLHQRMSRKHQIEEKHAEIYVLQIGLR
jgi:hypothetical protein